MAIDVGKLGTATHSIGTDLIDDPLFEGDSFDREYATAEAFQNDDPDQPINPADFTGYTPTVSITGSPFSMSASFPTPTNGKLRLQIAQGASVAGEYCYEVEIVDVGPTVRKILQKGTIQISAKVVP